MINEIPNDAKLEIRGYALYVNGILFKVELPDGYDIWKLDEDDNLVLSIGQFDPSVTLTRSEIKGCFVTENT